MSPLPPGGPVPRDPALPSLGDALDPVLMGARLRALDPEVAQVEIAYARYKPGLSCVLEYRARSARGARSFLGRVCTAAGFEPLAAKASANLRPGSKGGKVVHLYPDLRLILTDFPHDRAVRGLRFVLDPDKLKHVLHRAVDRYGPARRRVSGSDSRLAVVTYKPERRCLVRCDLGVRDLETGGLSRETIYARIYNDATGGRVFDLLRDLHRDPSLRDSGAPVPRALGYDENGRTIFFEEVPGEPMTGLCGGAGFAAAAERAGALLARLHGARVDVPRLHRPESLLSEARASIERLAAAGAREAESLLGSVDRLRRTRPAGEGTGRACVHGDFHPGQILAHGDRFHCVDFDEAGMGELALDLGYFVAHLRRLVHLGLLDSDGERRAAARFLAGYAGTGGSLPAPVLLDWHRDLTLVRMALTSVKHLETGWPESVRFYLEGIGR